MAFDFDRFLRRKMAAIFIMKPRRSYGYAYVSFFYNDHFSHHIEPAKPKHHGYITIIFKTDVLK